MCGHKIIKIKINNKILNRQTAHERWTEYMIDILVHMKTHTAMLEREGMDRTVCIYDDDIP